MGGVSLNGQGNPQGVREYNACNPADLYQSLESSFNPVPIGDMIGINETGLVFWEKVYKSNSDAPGNIVQPDVVNSFLATFSKIRIFHQIYKDYNLGGQTYKNPSNSNISECNISGVDYSRNYMCALRDFYDVLRNADGDGNVSNAGYPFICSASEASDIAQFPSKWFSYSQWGGNLGATFPNIEDYPEYQNAKAYAIAFLKTMDPVGGQKLVDRFYTTNELWGWSSDEVAGFHRIVDGFIAGFDEYYNGPNWNVELWLGAYQAHDNDPGVWGNDFIGTMMNDNARNNLGGIDVHPYSFVQNGNSSSVLVISEHPESVNSYFQSLKCMADWRNNNNENLSLSATEFGWNSDDTYVTANYTFNGVPYYRVLRGHDGQFTTSDNPVDWAVEQHGVGQEAQAVYSTRAFLLLARYGYESGYLYASIDNNEVTYQETGVYETKQGLTDVPNGFHRFDAHVVDSDSDWIGEKMVMPAMRKLRDMDIIGDKHFLEVLSENDNGVYAMLFGDDADHPTHLVAWNAVNINMMNEATINAMTITQLASDILPADISIDESAMHTLLDWNEGTTNNMDVYDESTGELTLTPIPVVIPLEASSVACDVTIPVVRNRCISLYADVGEDILTNDQSANWMPIRNLSDGLESTRYETKIGGYPANEIYFIIPILEPTTPQLILHWRAFVDQNRNNPVNSLQSYMIHTSIDGVVWDLVGNYTNSWRDNYQVFDIDLVNPPKYIRVTETSNMEHLNIVRLDIYEKAPDGERDDIWLFIGNSVTKTDLTPSGESNAKIFSHLISNQFSCQYPIVIDAGYGGEKATEMDDDNFFDHGDNLTSILNAHPEITFVPICYGLNDIMRSGTGTDGLTPYGDEPIPTTAFFDAMRSMIDKVNGTCGNLTGRVAIPSRVPWAIFPAPNYCATCVTGGITPFNSGDANYPNLDYMDKIIAEKTPYAMNGNIPYADFETPFKTNASTYIGSDGVHHTDDGKSAFNQIWVDAASAIVYNGLQANSCGSTTATCHDYTITNDATWPDAVNYPGPYGKVEVKNNATLTINTGYEARFCTDGELIISDGGKVDLNGTLTADDVYWKGVRMTGNDENISFTSSSFAVIEKATTGLRSLLGTVNCTGTTIQNNRIGVACFGFQTDATFTDCTFKNTTAFSYPNGEFIDFASLAFMSDGPDFLGCSFIEERANPNDAGVGISTFNANFSIDKTNANVGVFQNLIYGVHSSTYGIFSVNEELKVHNAIFNNCRVGIDAIFPSDCDIRYNEFNLSDPYRINGGDWQAQRQYGVYFHGAALGFVLEDNSFSFDCTACPGGCSGCTSWNRVGTQMSGIGEAGNVIRRNDYTGVPLANIAYGKNGDPVVGTGLLYECNNMHSNPIDFLTGLDPVIKFEQGEQVGFDLFKAADNIFDVNTTNNDFIHEPGGQQPSIEYYWKVSKPDNVSANITVKEADVKNGCASSQKPPKKKLTDTEKNTLLEEYKALAYQYDEARLAFNEAKNGNDAELIKEKRRNLSYVSRLKWEKVLYGMRSAAFESNRTEARAWLGRFGTYGADILLAQDYAATQEWGAAHHILDMLSQKYELTDADYAEVQDVRHVFNLLTNQELNQLDEQSRAELNDIAGKGSGIPRVMAQSIMSFYGKYYAPLFAEVPVLEGENNGYKDTENDGPRLKISPNPVDYNVRFDWSEFVVSNDQEVTIEITNKNGGLITILHPAKGVSELEWTTESVSSGIIYYRLKIGGQVKDSGQIYVNK